MIIKKNIKGYLKDKYIKNPNRFWNIEFLKSEITPNRKYIIKNNILYYYYIKKKHTELNIDRVLRQLNKELMVSLKIKEKLLNYKFFVYNEFPKNISNRKVELKYLIDEYNLTSDDVLSILKGKSLKNKLNFVRIICSDEIRVIVGKLIENYNIHIKKYLEVFSTEENKLLKQYLDFSHLPENEVLTNTQILKCFNKKKSLVSVESKVKYSGKFTAPRWYRKKENKKLVNKSYREVEYNIKNGDYDLVTTKAIRYVRNGSWYF